MGQELVTKTKQEVGAVSQYAGMGMEEMSVSDIQISRIHLLQSTSNIVKDSPREFFAGDIIDMQTKEKLGDTESALTIIPLYFKKDFTVEIPDGQKWKFVRKEAYSKENSHRETKREEVIGGVNHRWVLNINVYVMLEKDLGNPAAFPYLLCFRMTQLKFGKDLFTTSMKAVKAGLPIWSFKTPLKSALTDNDKGKWSAFSLGKTEFVKDRENYDLDFATWCNMIKSGAAVATEEIIDDPQGQDVPF